MTDSMLQFISFFYDTLAGPDGLAAYTLFTFFTGLLIGFILCFLWLCLSEFLGCVVPFFKRKLKVFMTNHHSDE